MRTQVKLLLGTVVAISLLILIYRIVSAPERAQARSESEPQPPPYPASVGSPDSPNQMPPRLNPTAPSAPGDHQSESATRFDTLPALPASSPPQLPTNPLDQILDDPSAVDAQKVQRLLSLIPNLPPSSVAEAALHLAQLTPDEDYQPVADLVLRTDLPEEVYELLMADLTDRPDMVRLPLLLQIARTPNHPESAEALEDLGFFLEEDFGTNWAAWEASLQSQLRPAAF